MYKFEKELTDFMKHWEPEPDIGGFELQMGSVIARCVLKTAWCAGANAAEKFYEQNASKPSADYPPIQFLKEGESNSEKLGQFPDDHCERHDHSGKSSKENKLDIKYLRDKVLRLSRKDRSKRHRISLRNLLEKFKAKTIVQLKDSQLADFNQELDFIYSTTANKAETGIPITESTANKFRKLILSPGFYRPETILVLQKIADEIYNYHLEKNGKHLIKLEISSIIKNKFNLNYSVWSIVRNLRAPKKSSE